MVRPPRSGPATGIDVSDIFAEVEEDLRAERIKRIFQRYGGLMIAAAVAVVLGTAAWKGWDWYQARARTRAATAYLAAMQQAAAPADQKAAITAFEGLARQGDGLAGSPGYRALALLQLAALRDAAGGHAEALGLWDQVAADSAADPVLRDTARLQWALHRLDSADKPDIATAVQAHLQPLLDPANPLHSLAEEARALMLLREGKKDQALPVLKRLAQDVTAPQGVRARAAGLTAQLGGKLGE